MSDTKVTTKVTIFQSTFSGWCWVLWRRWGTSGWACLASGSGYESPGEAKRKWREFVEGTNSAVMEINRKDPK